MRFAFPHSAGGHPGENPPGVNFVTFATSTRARGMVSTQRDGNPLARSSNPEFGLRTQNNLPVRVSIGGELMRLLHFRERQHRRDAHLQFPALD